MLLTLSWSRGREGGLNAAVIQKGTVDGHGRSGIGYGGRLAFLFLLRILFSLSIFISFLPALIDLRWYYTGKDGFGGVTIYGLDCSIPTGRFSSYVMVESASL